jgi:hypothetical protein
MDRWLVRLRRRELGAQSATLALASLMGWMLVAAITAMLGGPRAWLAAALVAGTCWLGAQLALVLCCVLERPQDAAKAALLGMLPRMGIPLTLAVVLTRILPQRMLADLGGLYYLMVLLVVFYHWTLATEITLLLVGQASGPRRKRLLALGAGTHPNPLSEREGT